MPRISVRKFLLALTPVIVLLTGSFWAMQKLVEFTVRHSLRNSLQATRRYEDFADSRVLEIAAGNSSLKASLRSMRKKAVEDQLSELCDRLGFDFLLVSTPNGKPLAGVWRINGRLSAVSPSTFPATGQGLMTVGADVYQIASAPVDRLGILSVGQRFEFSGFTVPAVLLQDGKVLLSAVPGMKQTAIEKALRTCSGECEIRLGGQSWISLPAATYGGGYTLRVLQNVDAAVAPIRHMLQRIFLFAATLAFIAALALGLRSRESKTAEVPTAEVREEAPPVREVREFTAALQQAAGAIEDARGNLQRAYLGFVGSLAGALDARDRYTAGHSRRVSDLSCATALALGITGERLEEVRIGALLHDIGKIAVPDSVLQKVGKLSRAEAETLKAHPQIGRRILEGITGFAPYLDSVELHHENWDGTGYPYNQRGLETPLAARIIHVADAYDAMTTDRPYRRGMSSEEAVAILRQCAGTQFDPKVVDAFAALCAVERKPHMLAA